MSRPIPAVFLDRATFSAKANLPTPDGINLTIFDSTPNDAKTIIERCQDAKIILTNKVLLTADIIKALPKLQLIQLTATGMNNVDADACRASGVSLQNVAGYAVNSVPEHTFMLLLSVMRAGMYYHRAATDGSWQADGRFCMVDEPIFDLAGRTLGIIGAGSIGRRVGEIGGAFGMKVLYAERQGVMPRDAHYTAFNEVLAQSDVISLHCPLTAETHQLINDDSIAMMAKKPVIINVARGDIVCADSILRGLDSGQISGFGADVFSHEPFSDNDTYLQLKDHPRVHFTPHNAWGSLAAQERLWEILCEQVVAFMAQHTA